MSESADRVFSNFQLPIAKPLVGQPSAPQSVSDRLHGANSPGDLQAQLQLMAGQTDIPAAGKERLLERCTAWAAAIPHHGISNFGEVVQAAQAIRYWIYRGVLRTYYERRELETRRAPYSGWEIPNRSVDAESVNVWSYELNAPQSFADGCEEFLIEDSQRVDDCAGCAATGRVACPECAGTGKIPCSTCAGHGNVRCHDCGGNGWVKSYRDSPVIVVCRSCSGQGNVGSSQCTACGGSGRKEEMQRETIQTPCGTCGHTGKLVCETCRGTGEGDCKRCQAEGKVTCTACEGQRRIVSYVVLRQRHEDGSGDVFAAPSSIPEPVYGRLSDSEYATVFHWQAPVFEKQLVQATASDELRSSVLSRVEEAQARLAAVSGRIARQELLMRRAHVDVVRYEYEGAEYAVYVLGESMEISAPDSPITRHLCKLMESASSDWEAGERKASLVAYLQAVEMGKADADCQAAFDACGSSIPLTLKTAAAGKQLFDLAATGVKQGKEAVQKVTGSVKESFGKLAGKWAAWRQKETPTPEQPESGLGAGPADDASAQREPGGESSEATGNSDRPAST